MMHLEFDAEIRIDVREKTLIQEFERHGASGYEINALPVGDLSCTYGKGGHSWIMERKTTIDFVASICDGRYNEQRERLFNTPHPVIFIIEGNLRTVSKWDHIMLSSLVSLNAGNRARVYRTWKVKETFDLVVVLIRKLEQPCTQTVPNGLSPPKVISKRKRDASPTICFIRMLCCIPSISEAVARKLVVEFGDLQSLQRALTDGTELRIELGNGRYLGKVRMQHLRRHLLGT